MARYGTLGDYRFADTREAASDIRGSKVYGANDQHLGKIDDVVFDEATGAILYLVVDTGGWLSSKKFLVPPQEIRPSVQHEDDFLVDLTKEQIESFPPYYGKTLNTEPGWADHEKRYRSQRVDAPGDAPRGYGRQYSPDEQAAGACRIGSDSGKPGRHRAAGGRTGSGGTG
jgi:sporulation protein YlmC with PRC-barrel domain